MQPFSSVASMTGIQTVRISDSSASGIMTPWSWCHAVYPTDESLIISLRQGALRGLDADVLDGVAIDLGADELLDGVEESGAAQDVEDGGAGVYGHLVFDVGLGEGDVYVGVVVASGGDGYFDEAFIEGKALEHIGDVAPVVPHAGDAVEEFFVLGEYGSEVDFGVKDVPGHEVTLFVELV